MTHQPEAAAHPNGEPVTALTMESELAKIGAHFRQGDVLAVRIKGRPESTIQPREHGSVVLAHGEVTGHMHQLRGATVARYRDDGGHEYLSVGAPDPLVHEEHSAIPVAPGDYELAQQVAYSPKEIVRAAD